VPISKEMLKKKKKKKKAKKQNTHLNGDMSKRHITQLKELSMAKARRICVTATTTKKWYWIITQSIKKIPESIPIYI